jgi:ParB/RepB/Spo0J family partition protein
MSEIYKTYQIEDLQEIAMSAIHSTPDDSNFGRGDPEQDPKVIELAENLKQHELIHPITVMESKDSTPEKRLYDVVIGNRRFAAWKIAHPEKETITCLVLPRDTTTTKRDMLAISENMLRLDYDPQDVAKIVKKLLPYWKNDRLRLAKALGYETAKPINDWLDLLDVETKVMESLKGPPSLKAKRARLIKKLPQNLQIPAAEILTEKDASDYDARRFVNALEHNPAGSPRAVYERLAAMPRTKSVFVTLSENLNDALEGYMAETREIKAAIVIKAITELLTKHDYLDAEGKYTGKRKKEEETTSTVSEPSV